jgi:hypothetical protein
MAARKVERFYAWPSRELGKREQVELNRNLCLYNQELKNRLKGIHQERRSLKKLLLQEQKRLNDNLSQLEKLVSLHCRGLKGPEEVSSIKNNLSNFNRITVSVSHNWKEGYDRFKRMTDDEKERHRKTSMAFVREAFKANFGLDTIHESSSESIGL